MTTYTFYAFDGTELEDMTMSEVVQGMAAGTIEATEIQVPIFINDDANNDIARYVEVTVIAPKGYALTDNDHARIDELIWEERKATV